MPDQAPRISIIICNYNYQDYVGAAIRSALAQDYPHTECIVVDDGSTDNSWQVIQTFPGIKAVRKPNGGQTDAAIFGLEQATGDVVLFLDSDDTVQPNACATIAARYRPETALYQYKLIKKDVSGHTVGMYPYFPFVESGHRAYVLQAGDLPSSPTSGNAFSMEHCRRMFALVRPQDRRNYFDGFLIFSAPLFGHVETVDEYLGSYLVHGSNVSIMKRTTKSLARNVRNALWQRTSILLALGEKVEADEQAARYLSPHHLQYALLARKGSGEQDLMPGLSNIRLFLLALVKSFTYPPLKLKSRAMNIAICGFALLAPSTLVRRVFFN